MDSKSMKRFVFAFFVMGAILNGVSVSFAQTDSSSSNSDNFSDEQAQERQTQQTLDDIHKLVLKMQENSKRLDALEKAVDESNSEAEQAPVPETPTVQVSVEKIPEPAVVPVQTAAPVQLAPVPKAYIMAQDPAFFTPIPSLFKEHTFELSQEDFYSNYKEPGDFSKKGGSYGLYSAYAFRPMDSEYWPINVFHLDVHGDYGKEDFDIDGDSKIKNINNYIVEPRVWLGKDFNLSSFITLTPYVGFGYRWDFDQLKNKFNLQDDGGFNIQTQYFYIPIGAQLSFRPTMGWRIDLNSEYDALAWDRVTSYYSDWGYGFSNAVNTSESGYGIRGGIKIVKENESMNFFIEPYIRYWDIKATNTVSVVEYGSAVATTRLGANKTAEIGARVGVEF